MKNFILRNRENLSESNYIRKADPDRSYWFDFSLSIVNKYKQNFGGSFNLIIAGSENDEKDFFIIPFEAVKHVFINENLSKDAPSNGKKRAGRWIGRIESSLLKISNSQKKIDISEYYGNPFLNNPELLENEIKKFVNKGAGFGNPETNRKVERAAIDVVINDYESKGWKVKSVEANKCGYDLHCTKNKEELHVEVKGIQGSLYNFIITNGEVERAKNDKKFIICAVTSALSNPKINNFTGEDFINNFDIQPLAFRATKKL